VWQPHGQPATAIVQKPGVPMQLQHRMLRLSVSVPCELLLQYRVQQLLDIKRLLRQPGVPQSCL
jgi:hypothetical protein